MTIIGIIFNLVRLTNYNAREKKTNEAKKSTWVPLKKSIKRRSEDSCSQKSQGKKKSYRIESVLKKSFRLDTKQYKSVFEKGEKHRFSTFLVKWFNETKDSRFSFGFSSRLKYSQTEKNYIKRRLYTYIGEKKNYNNMNKWVVFIIMKEIHKNNIEETFTEFDEIITFLNNEMVAT